MGGYKLSVVIPSYKDPLLKKTIEDLLEHSELGDELEIIAVLDGYWPSETVSDKRVRYVHLGKNRGMRDAINAGVQVSRGEFIMRTDEHCMFDQGFDRKMVEACQSNWIMTGVRYFLDPVKWERMDLKPYVYERLAIADNRKFEGRRWVEREKERADVMVDETMAMQGSCWVMPRKWWDEVIVELDSKNYGPLIQDSHEMVFKTWKAGGKLLVNKNTWFAHKHVSFTRTHQNGTPENPAKNEEGYAYALKTWKEYYLTEIAPKWSL